MVMKSIPRVLNALTTTLAVLLHVKAPEMSGYSVVRCVWVLLKVETPGECHSQKVWPWSMF